MQQIRRILRRLPIARRISLAFILLTTLLIAVITLVVRAMYSQLTYTQMQERMRYEAQLHTQQIQSFVDNANRSCNDLILSLNTAYMNQLGDPAFPNGDDIQETRAIMDIIDRAFIGFNDSSRTTVLFQNGLVCSIYAPNNQTRRRDLRVGRDAFDYLRERHLGLTGGWYTGLDAALGEVAGSLCYVKMLRTVVDTRTVGYVVMRVEEDALYRLYAGTGTEHPSGLYLCDSTDRVISSNQREAVGTPVSATPALPAALASPQVKGLEVTDDGTRYFSVVNTLRDVGWQYVSLTDVDATLSQVRLITGAILLVGAVLLVLFSLLIIAVSSTIATPISRLAQHMVSAGGEIPSELPETGTADEIGQLTANFNTMIRTNNALFDHLRRDQEKRRRLELALTQTQIKPHFLYNTLDTAYCLVDMNDKEAAKGMLKLLASHYRYVLNRGSDWITLGRELEALETYLQIQKMRYKDMLTYDIDIAPELWALRIPKLTLQPLVENAIYHGIKPKNAPGAITVRGRMEPDSARLTVEDDGVGMSQLDFDREMRGGTNREGSDSFGLKNVADRIRLFYGPASSLTLERPQAGGAVMMVTIRFDREDAHDV